MNEISKAKTETERMDELSRGDLEDLMDATEEAIKAGGGFGWIKPPHRDVMETYWRGVLLVPDRKLIVGRLDGVIAGSCQLVRPGKNNEAQSHIVQLTTSFVAPWARGHGLARQLTLAAEDWAREMHATILNLDVRETQEAAITLYRSLQYQEIGRHPCYAKVEGRFIAGIYFWKDLTI